MKVLVEFNIPEAWMLSPAHTTAGIVGPMITIAPGPFNQGVEPSWRIIDPAPQQKGGQDKDWQRFNDENGPMHMGEPVLPGKPRYRESVEDDEGYFLYGDMAIVYLRKKLEALQPSRSGLAQEAAIRIVLEQSRVYPDMHLVSWDNIGKLGPGNYDLFLHPAPLGDGWRPIETAPKGVPILISGYERDDKKNGPRFVASAMYRDDNWYSDEDENDTSTFYSPTHWQPLPAAPTGKGGE